MAILHRATVTPPMPELIGAWASRQPWGPPAGTKLRLAGTFRFDDPQGEVGMETHLVDAGGTLLQIPLTYRGAPLQGADDALVGQLEHSVLGQRWVYDGLRDQQFLTMLAAVTMTGQGQAVGMVEIDGRWCASPSAVRLDGGGWSGGAAPVDRFAPLAEDAEITVAVNDRFRLQVFRRPVAGPRPAIGLTASWHGLAKPVVLASLTERAEG